MNANSHYLIADTQSQGGFFAKLLHVTALNAIVLFRHGFGHNFVGPFFGFLIYWAGSVVISIALAAATGNPLGVALKVAILALFLLHYFSAKINLWMSNAPVQTWRRAPRNADYCGTSWISSFRPNDEWRIFLFIEPLCAVGLSVATVLVDRGLSLTLFISTVAMALKNWMAYNKFCVDTTGKTSQYTYTSALYLATQGSLGGVGTSYRPPPTAPPVKKTAAPKPRLRGQAASPQPTMPQQLPGAGTPTLPAARPVPLLGRIKGFFSPTSAQPVASPQSTNSVPQSPPGHNGAQQKFAKRQSPPPHSAPVTAPASPEEQEFALLLQMPPGGFADASQLREHWREAMKRWHPDKTQDPAKKAEATAKTRRVNDAYQYFRSRLEDPIGLQKPLS
jgi:hypothetical protein